MSSLHLFSVQYHSSRSEKKHGTQEEKDPVRQEDESKKRNAAVLYLLPIHLSRPQCLLLLSDGKRTRGRQRSAVTSHLESLLSGRRDNEEHVRVQKKTRAGNVRVVKCFLDGKQTLEDVKNPIRYKGRLS